MELVYVSSEPEPATAKLKADNAEAAALLNKAQDKLSDANQSKLVVAEGKVGSTVSNNALSEVIKISRNRERERVESTLSSSLMCRKKWPDGNLKILSCSDSQHVILHEVLPQLHVEPGDDPYIAVAWMGRELIELLGLKQPFAFEPNNRISIPYASI